MFDLLLPIHPGLDFKRLKHPYFLSPRLKAFELTYILSMFQQLLLDPLINLFDHLALFLDTTRPVFAVPPGQLLHLELSLTDPLPEVPPVLNVRELQSKHHRVLVFESLSCHLSRSVSNRTEGILPEGLLDGQMQGLDTAFAGLHILVPLGKDIAEFQAVVVVVHSVDYGLQGAGMFYLEHL